MKIIEILKPLARLVVLCFAGIGLSVTASELTKSCERTEHKYIGQMGEDGVMYYEEVK